MFLAGPYQNGLLQIKQTGFRGGIATAGPWSSGAGGVFLSLCSIRSSARGTFLPSAFTSNEKFTNSALPLVLLDATPPPAVPASSPVLVLKLESFTHSGLPSAFTLVAPFAVSEDFAAFGYGMGTGPPGVGVLQTSGKITVVPPLSACTTLKLLALTVTDISNTPARTHELELRRGALRRVVAAQ